MPSLAYLLKVDPFAVSDKLLLSVAITLDFWEGRTSIQDAPRPGAPKLATNNDKLSEVKEYVESFPNFSVEEVANYVGISTGSVHNLKADLELRKVQVRWVPHRLTFPQKAARLQMVKENLEIYEGSDPRQLLEIVTGDETWIQFKPPIRKQDGRLWLKKGEVPQLFVSDFRASETGTRGLKILHDNARPHKSLAVGQKIKDMGMHEVPHPPYSPDIAPCDFWLFRKLKDDLSGREFEDQLSLGRAIYRYLNVIAKDEYRKTFENWIKG
ncbi:Transposase [Oopsacas minuta]|uniref:Transposase n=1 Tax=Oopsacas minuta TaxID=111878 RepID=A0AAV7JMS1_9METZ|nr:Transposase [Oopsacas minuta]